MNVVAKILGGTLKFAGKGIWGLLKGAGRFIKGGLGSMLNINQGVKVKQSDNTGSIVNILSSILPQVQDVNLQSQIQQIINQFGETVVQPVKQRGFLGRMADKARAGLNNILGMNNTIVKSTVAMDKSDMPRPNNPVKKFFIRSAYNIRKTATNFAYSVGRKYDILRYGGEFITDDPYKINATHKLDKDSLLNTAKQNILKLRPSTIKAPGLDKAGLLNSAKRNIMSKMSAINSGKAKIDSMLLGKKLQMGQGMAA